MIDNRDSVRFSYVNLLQMKFPDWVDNPVLFLSHAYWQSPDKYLYQLPPLPDLVHHDIFRGKPILFSFQRSHRSYPGLVVLRKPDGYFLRTDSGDIWSISQLALSLSNAPSYLKNGNSPQGIYSVQGISNSKNIFIGPSPTLQTVLPWETAIDIYFHDKKLKNHAWSLDRYQQLLPTSWRNYLPIYEAYYAGMVGRSEIISHGTTIDPEYYRTEVFYPLTPSLGCLTTREIWSEVDGSCLVSDQLDLVNAYLSCGDKKGFLILIDLDDQKKAVTINDIPEELFLSPIGFSSGR